MKHLIEHFPSLQRIRDKFGASELHYAAMGGSVDVLEYLEGLGHDINDTDRDRQTVLHWACREGDNEDIVIHLTKKYPDLKHQLSVDGESALHTSVGGGSVQIIEHLISEGLDVYQCTNDGSNILQLAERLSPSEFKTELLEILTERFPSLKTT